MHFKPSIREIILAMLSGAFIFTTPAAVNAMRNESHPNQAPESQQKKLYIPPHRRRPANAGNSGNASSSSAAASPSAAAGSSASSRSSSVSPTHRRGSASAWTGNNPSSIRKPPSRSVQHHAASAHLAGTSSKTSSQTATEPVGVFPEWKCLSKNPVLNLADIQACLSDLLGQQQDLHPALISWLREKKHIVLPNRVPCKPGSHLPEKSFFESSVSFDTGRVAGCSVGKRTQSDLPPAIQCVVKGIKGCVVKGNTAREVDSARAIISSDTGELISFYPSR